MSSIIMSSTILSTIVLASFCVYSDDGSVDVEATNKKWGDNFSSWLAVTQVPNELIEAAVNSVFDQNPGVCINTPALLTFSLHALGKAVELTPANEPYLRDRLHKYVQANSQGEKREDGTYTRPDSTFVISKGKGGGAWRRADNPERVQEMLAREEKAAEKAAKAARKGK
jgi:hypothetical protein